MDRYLAPFVERDLQRKMVFLCGSRQVGKTTLARSLLKGDLGYLNWDVAEHRERILRRRFPDAPRIVFDEIHKYRSWRNYLKGICDDPQRRFQILVTGSARLDLYRRGGDSLQGRYHFLRLHPLSVGELKLREPADFDRLLRLGGFPEPYLAGDPIFAQRWSRDYRTRIIREEVSSLEQVQDLGNLELLVLRLPELVGSPLSLNALREDLQVSHRTVSRWLDILERLYVCFRLTPFGSPKIKAVKKERKLYLTDWTQVPNPGDRFENLVACHLLKWVHFLQDTQGRDVELHYIRDITGREVDFLITERRKPTTLIECKLGETSVGPALRYLRARFPGAEALQVTSGTAPDSQTHDGIRVRSALRFLGELV